MGVGLVTGAGAGIGHAIALRMAKDGLDVGVVDIDVGAAEKTAGEIRKMGRRALAISADVTKATDVAAFVARTEEDLGPIDAFVANAGIEGVVAPIHEYPDDVFERVLSVNVRGVFLSLKHVTQRMLPRGRGAIVVTCSTSSIRGRGSVAGYVSSKHAALGLVRVAALDMQAAGIRVNAVLPGPIETRMIQSFEDMHRQRGRPASQARKRGEVEDVANTVSFLLSDQAKHVTGAAWVIDGGSTLA